MKDVTNGSSLQCLFKIIRFVTIECEKNCKIFRKTACYIAIVSTVQFIGFIVTHVDNKVEVYIIAAEILTTTSYWHI